MKKGNKFKDAKQFIYKNPFFIEHNNKIGTHSIMRANISEHIETIMEALELQIKKINDSQLPDLPALLREAADRIEKND